MALIKCPECEKEVSSRAKACPFCGFPIEDYLCEKEEEKEQQRLEEEFETKKQYNLFGIELSVCKNEMICSVICSQFYKVTSVVREIVARMVTEKSIRPCFVDPMEDFVGLYNSIMTPILEPYNKTGKLLVTYYSKYEVENEEIENLIYNRIEALGIRDTMFRAQNKLYEELRAIVLKFNRETNSELDLLELNATQPGRYDSLAGYIIDGIRQNIDEKKTTNNIKERLKIIEKCADRFDNKIFSIIRDNILNIQDAVIDEVLDCLLDNDGITEKINYKNIYPRISRFVEMASDDQIDNSVKIDTFKYIITDCPMNLDTYTTMFQYVYMNSDSIVEIKRIISDAGMQRLIMDWIDSTKSLAKAYYDDNLSIDQAIHNATKDIRSYNGIEFNTIEDKKAYIQEEIEREIERKKKKEDEQKNRKCCDEVNSILKSVVWYDKKNIESSYKKICDYKERIWIDPWKKEYEERIGVLKRIIKEIDNKNYNRTISGIRAITSDSIKIHVMDLYSETDNVLNKYIDVKGSEICCNMLKKDDEDILGISLKELIGPNELVVKTVDGAGHIILVTTRAYYVMSCISKDETILDYRIEFDDVAYVKIDDKKHKIIVGLRTGKDIEDVTDYCFEKSKYDQNDGYDKLLSYWKAIETDIKNNPINVEREKEIEKRNAERKKREEEELKKRREKEKEEALIICEHNVANMGEESALKIYSFRKLLKSFAKRSFEYTYDTSLDGKCSKYLRIINPDYKSRGEYVLGRDVDCVVTDRTIYIQKYELPINDLQEIIKLDNVESKSSYYYIFIYSNKWASIKSNNEYSILDKVSLALQPFRVKGYICSDKSGLQVGFCEKCNGNRVKMGLLGGKCLKCGNKNGKSLYVRIPAQNNENDDYIKMVDEILKKKGGLFSDEDEWLDRMISAIKRPINATCEIVENDNVQEILSNTDYTEGVKDDLKTKDIDCNSDNTIRNVHTTKENNQSLLNDKIDNILMELFEEPCVKQYFKIVNIDEVTDTVKKWIVENYNTLEGVKYLISPIQIGEDDYIIVTDRYIATKKDRYDFYEISSVMWYTKVQDNQTGDVYVKVNNNEKLFASKVQYGYGRILCGMLGYVLGTDPQKKTIRAINQGGIYGEICDIDKEIKETVLNHDSSKQQAYMGLGYVFCGNCGMRLLRTNRHCGNCGAYNVSYKQ